MLFVQGLSKVLNPEQSQCNIPKFLCNLYFKLVFIFNQTLRFKISYRRVSASPHEALQKERKQYSSASLMPTDDKGESSVYRSGLFTSNKGLWIYRTMIHSRSKRSGGRNYPWLTLNQNVIVQPVVSPFTDNYPWNKGTKPSDGDGV